MRLKFFSPIVRSRLTAFGICWLLALAGTTKACFYGDNHFNADDKSQTTAYDLIRGKYMVDVKEERLRAKSEFARLTKEAPRKGNEPDFIDTYGFYLYRNGKAQEAEKQYRQLLTKQPNRYSTLCNYATLLHLLYRYDDASAVLKQALALRPSFRNSAEAYHLQMIAFQKQQKQNYQVGSKKLFMDELTPIWAGRKAPPETFEKTEFPEINADGVAELVRQFPSFGEGWLVLGMLMEHEGDNSLALRAYEKAVETGTARRSEIVSHLRDFRPFAEYNDSARAGGRRIFWLIIIGGSLTVLYLALRFSRMIILDISTARAEKLNRRKPKDPDAPL